MGNIPDVESIDFRGEMTSAGKAVEVHLSSDDQNMLTLAVDDLKREISAYPGVSDVSDSFLRGKRNSSSN